jgi:hypothetical protein
VLIVDADTNSLDNLEFRFTVSGGAELSEIGPVFGISKDDMSGRIAASVNLQESLTAPRPSTAAWASS